jgi:CBS domain-containing protein
MVLKAKDVMHRGDLITVSPRTKVEELKRLLIEKQISAAPVVNDGGELVGLVSQRDFVKLLHDEHESLHADPKEFVKRIGAMTVLEIMETRLHTVSPETDISTVAKILRKHHIHRVLVVDGKGLVGIISTLDLIRPYEDPEFVSSFFGKPSGWEYWTPMQHARSEKAAVAPKARSS